MILFSVGQLNFVLMSIFAVLLILQTALKYPTPVSWVAVYWMFFYGFCYRAFLFYTAKLSGVSRDGDLARPVEMVASPSLAPSLRTTMTREITPQSIGEVLNQEYIVNAIKSDLRKTDQVGYRETWRLGLITPDQDWYDPRLDSGSLQERTKRYLHDRNERFKWIEQIPVKRTAVLHSTGYFNAQFNNLLVINGIRKHHLPYGRSYSLRTRLGIGELISIRDIRINVSSSSTQDREVNP